MAILTVQVINNFEVNSEDINYANYQIKICKFTQFDTNSVILNQILLNTIEIKQSRFSHVITLFKLVYSANATDLLPK